MKTRIQHERGTTLIEALVAFLVLSLGLVTVSRVEHQLRLTGETARQRSEAVRLAQEDIEQLRSFARLEAFATGRSYADVVDSAYTLDAASGYASNTAYRVERRVLPASVASARNVSVSVAWSDRAGDPQSVRLESVLAANDPALSGALGLAPAHSSLNGPMARAIHIPRGARNLGTGKSSFSLADGAATVFLFDNDSGIISERCDRVAGSGPGDGSAEPSTCKRVSAYLLSGVVRVPTTEASMSNAATSSQPMLPAIVMLELADSRKAAVPECSTTAMLNTAGDRYLQYACVVYPGATGRWSGDTRLLANGRSLGPKLPDYRVCPYVADTGGSYAHTGRSSPPQTGDFGRLGQYSDVPGSLANQNFQLIAVNLPCPD